jgi:subtilase family serine protease
VSDDLPPDLVVAALSAPGAVAAGTPFTVTDTTANQGAGFAEGSTTSYSLSPSSGAGGPEAAATLIGERAVPPLAAGAIHTGSVSLTIPAGTPAGSYSILARADTADAVLEDQEANNTRSVPVRVGPDLAVTALIGPDRVGTGVAFTVTDTTTNQGAAAAEGSTTGFYLSADALVDAGDVRLAGRTVPAMAAGASDSGPVTLTIPPATAPATYYLLALADDFGAVGESLETNNAMARSIQVGPDLLVTILTAPSTVRAGVPFRVTATTTNEGAAAAASTTSFYLSPDTAFDAADVLLDTRAVPALAEGASHTDSFMLRIPRDTPSDSYYLVVRADAADTVGECVEANNVLVRPLQVTVVNSRASAPDVP